MYKRQVYRFLGAHEMDYKGTKGVDFAIWAPEALRVSVVGEFNNWDGRIHQLEAIDSTGVFELFVPGVKMCIRDRFYRRR